MLGDVLETSLHYRRVREFMRKAKQATPDHVTPPTDDERIRMASLIIEEAFELIKNGLGLAIYSNARDMSSNTNLFSQEVKFMPFKDPNLVETVDGVCDLHVVATCVLAGCGIPDVAMQTAVDSNNLLKFTNGGYINEVGKFVKPPDHKGPDIEGLLNQIANTQMARNPPVKG